MANYNPNQIENLHHKSSNCLQLGLHIISTGILVPKDGALDGQKQLIEIPRIQSSKK